MSRQKTFAEGVDELKAMAGPRHLTGVIRVNQVYAHYQDSGRGPHGKPAAAFSHPRGGKAEYLSGQMRVRRDEFIQGWADQVLRGSMVSNFIRDLTSVADRVFVDAPREFEVLRNSTALALYGDGAPIFERPPLVARLSEAQIKALRGVRGGSLTPKLKVLGKLR